MLKIFPFNFIPEHSLDLFRWCLPPTMAGLLIKHSDGTCTLTDGLPSLLPVPCQNAWRHPVMQCSFNQTYSHKLAIWKALNKACTIKTVHQNGSLWLGHVLESVTVRHKMELNTLPLSRYTCICPCDRIYRNHQFTAEFRHSGVNGWFLQGGHNYYIQDHAAQSTN